MKTRPRQSRGRGVAAVAPLPPTVRGSDDTPRAMRPIDRETDRPSHARSVYEAAQAAATGRVPDAETPAAVGFACQQRHEASLGVRDFEERAACRRPGLPAACAEADALVVARRALAVPPDLLAVGVFRQRCAAGGPAQ